MIEQRKSHTPPTANMLSKSDHMPTCPPTSVLYQIGFQALTTHRQHVLQVRHHIKVVSRHTLPTAYILSKPDRMPTCSPSHTPSGWFPPIHQPDHMPTPNQIPYQINFHPRPTYHPNVLQVRHHIRLVSNHTAPTANILSKPDNIKSVFHPQSSRSLSAP